MEKIAILTDSTCDLSQSTMDTFTISSIPLRIVYKDREYRDRIDITPEAIYERLSTEIPKTSLPSPEDALAAVDALVELGYTHILGIFISGGLSGTFNMLRGVFEEYDRAVIKLVDSKSLSLGLGFPVLEGAKAVAEGLGFDEVESRVRAACKETHVAYIIKTLEYLKAGGRIGKVEGTIGELLDIKPVISINEEGIYYTLKKVRGRKKSIAELIEFVKQYARGPIRVGILHGAALEEGEALKESLAQFENIQEVFFEQISPVLTVHTGPGLLAVVIQTLS